MSYCYPLANPCYLTIPRIQTLRPNYLDRLLSFSMENCPRFSKKLSAALTVSRRSFSTPLGQAKPHLQNAQHPTGLPSSIRELTVIPEASGSNTH